eukprot:4915992-Karenia_brevis.AAC.1
MMAQAKVEEMLALLQFAAWVQELATIPEWPAESIPPTLRRRRRRRRPSMPAAMFWGEPTHDVDKK